MYACARRFLARLASEIFLSSLQINFSTLTDFSFTLSLWEREG